MSIVSVNQVLRFVPYAWRDDKNLPKDGAPVYLIRPPSIMTKARWRRDLGEAGADPSPPDRETMAAVLKRGIGEIVAEHQQPSLLALVEEYDAAFARVQELRAQDSGDRAELEAAAERLRAVSPRMAFLEREMSGKYPPYAQVLAARTFWFEVAPFIAARHFLCGWENVELDFEVVNGLVPEMLLNQLPSEHVYDVGWRAMGLTAATQADEKNSGGASGSGASPTRSAPTRKAPGSSTAKPSKKTPGQASPAGSPT